jgi:hypothetical protein
LDHALIEGSARSAETAHGLNTKPATFTKNTKKAFVTFVIFVVLVLSAVARFSDRLALPDELDAQLDLPRAR